MSQKTTVTPADASAENKIRIPLLHLVGRRKTDLPPEQQDELRHARDSLLWKTLVYAVLLLASVVALLFSYTLKPHLVVNGGQVVAESANAELGASFLKDLGIAGLVAIFLAFTFEQLSTKEFEKLARREQNRIKRDVFEYVYGHHVPEDIRKEIHAKVLTAKFVRESIELSYTLTPLAGPSGRYMQVDLVARCAVRNLTNRPEQYRVAPSVERALAPEFADRVGFRFLEITGTREPLGRLDESELKERGYIAQDDLNVSLKPPQPVILPHSPAIITAGYRSIAHLDGGYDYFMFADHTCRTTVTVHVPTRDYDVALRDFGFEELRPHSVHHQPEQGRFHWDGETPILKNQGIFITWAPKTQRAAGSVPDATAEL